MTVGSDGERLYAFGGMTFSPHPDGTIRPDPLSAAYAYDPEVRAWTPLPARRGLHGPICGAPQKNIWSEGPPLPCPRAGKLPAPEPMVTVPAVIWKDWIVLVSGEVRPGRRSPVVLGLAVRNVGHASGSA